MHPRGKVCVVTGAASGIGEAVARAYAEAGAKGVVIADLNAERLAKVASDIDALAVPTDVSQESDIKALIDKAEARFGPVDVFYSNAGISRAGQQDASDADWDLNCGCMSSVTSSRRAPWCRACWHAVPVIY